MPSGPRSDDRRAGVVRCPWEKSRNYLPCVFCHTTRGTNISLRVSQRPGHPQETPENHQERQKSTNTLQQTRRPPKADQETSRTPENYQNTTETAPREHQYIIRTIRDEHCDQERPPGKNQEETNRRQPRNGRRRPGHPLRSAGDTGKAGPKRNSFKSSCHKCARCPMANRCASLPRGQPPISRRMHDPFMHHGDVTAK